MKNNLKLKAPRKRLFAYLLVAAVLQITMLDVPRLYANSQQQLQQLQQQIGQVQNDTANKREAQGVLSIEASSLSDAITKLQSQIDSAQGRINELQGDVDALNSQIAEVEIELKKYRALLGENIRAMYVEGDISTLEMLASSKDLSHFIDRQQYRESIQNKIKSMLDKVNELQAELKLKRGTVEATMSEQKELQDQLKAQQSEKDRILALNQSQRDTLENQIRANSGKLAELKKKQAEAEAALARSLNSGSYRVGSVGAVAAGDVVGTVGNSGFSSGPHLHLEVRTGSRIVNPNPYIQTRPVSMPPAWISQSYGVANSLYRSGYHTGIDYASWSNSAIYAIAGGQLYRGCSDQILGTSNNAYGYVAIVEHPNGTKSVYAHMSAGPSSCSYNTY